MSEALKWCTLHSRPFLSEDVTHIRAQPNGMDRPCTAPIQESYTSCSKDQWKHQNTVMPFDMQSLVELMRDHLELLHHTESTSDELILHRYPPTLRKKVLRCCATSRLPLSLALANMQPQQGQTEVMCPPFKGCRTRFLDEVIGMARMEIFNPEFLELFNTGFQRWGPPYKAGYVPYPASFQVNTCKHCFVKSMFTKQDGEDDPRSHWPSPWLDPPSGLLHSQALDEPLCMPLTYRNSCVPCMKACRIWHIEVLCGGGSKAAFAPTSAEEGGLQICAKRQTLQGFSWGDAGEHADRRHILERVRAQ
eukprot:scaffold87271_cov17-Tisochrysis_lutea.AAC.2